MRQVRQKHESISVENSWRRGATERRLDRRSSSKTDRHSPQANWEHGQSPGTGATASSCTDTTSPRSCTSGQCSSTGGTRDSHWPTRDRRGRRRCRGALESGILVSHRSDCGVELMLFITYLPWPTPRYSLDHRCVRSAVEWRASPSTAVRFEAGWDVAGRVAVHWQQP